MVTDSERLDIGPHFDNDTSRLVTDEARLRGRENAVDRRQIRMADAGGLDLDPDLAATGTSNELDVVHDLELTAHCGHHSSAHASPISSRSAHLVQIRMIQF
jgi:hypothetical protein